MKRLTTLLLFAACLCIALPAKAQFLQFGLKGGANVSKISFNKDDMGGFFFGPMAEMTIPGTGFGIDAAALYNQKGIKTDEYNFKQSGFDIPVNLKYTLALGQMFGIYVAAGPDFFFNFKNDYYDIRKRKSTVGMNFGAGFKLFGHLQLGFNYNIPLKESGQVIVSDGHNVNYKIKTWQMSAAYMF